MRILLILLLLAPLILLAGAQEPADSPPDIQIDEFSWSKFRTYGPATTGNQKISKVDARSREIISREQLQNRNSIENRSRDMLELEQNVARESRNLKPVDMFRYRVRLKNTGVKIVKLVIWEYQSSQSDDFAEALPRQFRCTAKIKPNQSERLEGFSILPPTRVITASEDGKNFYERVMINRIEYADGASWQRSQWRVPEVTAAPYGKGNCEPL